MKTYETPQNGAVPYIADTGQECKACHRDTMHVRLESSDKAKGQITQQLECPTCGATYPRTVGLDRVQVLHDPTEGNESRIGR